MVLAGPLKGLNVTNHERTNGVTANERRLQKLLSLSVLWKVKYEMVGWSPTRHKIEKKGLQATHTRIEAAGTATSGWRVHTSAAVSVQPSNRPSPAYVRKTANSIYAFLCRCSNSVRR
jgi:hypothetical protein